MNSRVKLLLLFFFSYISFYSSAYDVNTDVVVSGISGKEYEVGLCTSKAFIEKENKISEQLLSLYYDLCIHRKLNVYSSLNPTKDFIIKEPIHMQIKWTNANSGEIQIIARTNDLDDDTDNIEKLIQISSNLNKIIEEEKNPERLKLRIKSLLKERGLPERYWFLDPGFLKLAMVPLNNTGNAERNINDNISYITQLLTEYIEEIDIENNIDNRIYAISKEVCNLLCEIKNCNCHIYVLLHDNNYLLIRYVFGANSNIIIDSASSIRIVRRDSQTKSLGTVKSVADFGCSHGTDCLPPIHHFRSYSNVEEIRKLSCRRWEPGKKFSEKIVDELRLPFINKKYI